MPTGENSLAREWGRNLLGLAVLTVPTLVITQTMAAIQGKLLAQPWQILWVALPLTLLSVYAWKQLKGRSSRRFDLQLAIFLGCYVTAFALLSASDLLVWKRVPLDKSVGTPARNWLLPVAWGDWRYLLVRDSAPEERLLLLLEDRHEGWKPEEKRRFDARMIGAAVAGGAKGIFFDVSYEDRAPRDAEVFCAAVEEALDAGIPIITTYGIRRNPATQMYEQVPQADAAETPHCLLEQASRPVYRAHAMVLADVDSTVRSIPVAWVDAPERSALSVRIAQCMQASGCKGNDLKLPDDALLRYLPRVAPLTTRKGDAELLKLQAAPAGLHGKYLLIGERSAGDSFGVPGETQLMPGALIHAHAVNSLLSGRYFERPPAWCSAFIVIAACGVLTLAALRSHSLRRLLLVAAIESLAILLLAGFAATALLVWLDAIYALVALWLLLPLLLAYRRLAAERPIELQLVEQPAPTTTA